MGFKTPLTAGLGFVSFTAAAIYFAENDADTEPILFSSIGSLVSGLMFCATACRRDDPPHIEGATSSLLQEDELQGDARNTGTPNDSQASCDDTQTTITETDTENHQHGRGKDESETESAQPSHVGFHGSKNQENTKPNPEKMAGTVKVYPTYTKLNP